MKHTLLFALFTLAFGLLLVACGTSSAASVSSTAIPPTITAASSEAASCATKNHAPFDAFRRDPPSKLTASAKPKLVEFYAVW